jgi:hypothetical protein
VVKILKGNGSTVIVFDSGFPKGRPFEVFTEILYVGLVLSSFLCKFFFGDLLKEG